LSNPSLSVIHAHDGGIIRAGTGEARVFLSKSLTFYCPVNPKEYLTDVLTRLPGMLAKDAKILTPANWLKARSGKEIRRAA
jgi:hypothetical protein